MIARVGGYCAWGSRRYCGSIGTAIRALRFLEEYGSGERNSPVLSMEEIRSCIDAPIRDVRSVVGKMPRTVQEVWDVAQWCREREVLKFAGVTKNWVRELVVAGYVHRERKAWFDDEWAIPLYGALYLKKYMQLRPFLQRALGPVERWDADTLTSLPLETLLGIITHPEIVRTLCTVHVGRKNE